MNTKTAIMLLEHTSYDDFNLLEHQIKSRLEAIQVLIQENQQLHNKIDKAIEYIKTEVVMSDGTKLKNTIEGAVLLKILKDSDIDE